MDEANHSADGRVRASASEVVQQSAQARAAAQGKSRFLAAVGDRLRQPLHAMPLFIGALQRNATPPQQPSIDRLQGLGDALGGLLEETGRASCRARVLQHGSITVVAVSCKKKNK